MTQDTSDGFDQAFKLVGEYMFNWASLETELNRAVHLLLGLEGIDGYVTTANTSFRDKLHLVRTLTALYGLRHGEAWAKQADKLLNSLGDIAAERNTVAHNMFAPKDGGVLFYVVKAKGKFSVPDVVWTEGDFNDKVAAMNAAQLRLRLTVRRVAEAKKSRDAPPKPVNVFALSPPTSGTGLLGQLLDLSPPAPEQSGSPSANLEEGPQTPQEPEGQ